MSQFTCVFYVSRKIKKARKIWKVVVIVFDRLIVIISA